MNNRILVIRTGGTFDSKRYKPPYTLENPPKIVDTLKGAESLVAALIKDELGYQDVDIHEWSPEEEDRYVVDSQEHNRQKLLELANFIRNSDYDYFLLPHGSSEGVVDAQVLLDALALSGKTVVVEAAMVPLSMRDLHESDGVAITDFALQHIRNQPAGVWVAGYNTAGDLGFFHPHEVVKHEGLSKERFRFTLTSWSR